MFFSLILIKCILTYYRSANFDICWNVVSKYLSKRKLLSREMTANFVAVNNACPANKMYF